MTDGELVALARQGKAQALAELLNRWAPRALALCHVHANRQAAHDLAQDSLLRAIRNLQQLKSPDQFGPWLRGIVKRVCLDWIDSKRRSMIPFSTLEKGDFNVNEVPEQQPEQREDVEQQSELQEAINDLPLDCQEAIRLFYAGNMTYQEMGKLLDVSAATINARLTKARMLLRERLVPRVETRT